MQKKLWPGTGVCGIKEMMKKEDSPEFLDTNIENRNDAMRRWVPPRCVKKEKNGANLLAASKTGITTQ